jgi:predicted PurR-regulated permease PerM
MSETDDTPVESIGSSPAQLSDPRLHYEAKRALVWTAVVGSIVLATYLVQPLLIIFGAMVFACMIDGGARLVGRALPLARGWRIAIVLIGAAAFLIWLIQFAGYQIAEQATQLPALVDSQLSRANIWLQSMGVHIRIDDLKGLVQQLFSGVGTVTRALGGLIGGIANLVLIVVLGIYIALEPRLYQRGIAWMIADDQREGFQEMAEEMAYTLRRLLSGRLLGMLIEGVFTWALLALYGVPMAALLGLLTGLLAFIPNIGAIVSGTLMVLVGFSGGTEMGLYAVGVYFAVQTIDGYVLVPMIARKTVDLAPALVLAAQLVMGVLFGIIGLTLADPLVAMAKVALQRRSRRIDQQQASISIN